MAKSRHDFLTIPAILALITPWQERVTSIKLISDYYQPDISILSSVVGFLLTLSTLAWATGRISRRRRARLLAFFSALAATTGFFCFFMFREFDVSLQPGEMAGQFLKYVWLVSYVGFGAAISITLGLAMLFFRTE